MHWTAEVPMSVQGKGMKGDRSEAGSIPFMSKISPDTVKTNYTARSDYYKRLAHVTVQLTRQIFQDISDHYKIWMQKSCNENKGLIISIY